MSQSHLTLKSPAGMHLLCDLEDGVQRHDARFRLKGERQVRQAVARADAPDMAGLSAAQRAATSQPYLSGPVGRPWPRFF